MVKCKQVTCQVHVDGKCLESFDPPRDCPHFYFEETNDASSQISSPEETTSQPAQVSLFSGDELSLKELTFLTYKYPTKVIVIIGESECGKTTLLGTICDMFQIAPIGKFLFAGSVTLIGFEKRSHLSRKASNLSRQDTERTKSKEFNFLHLAVKKENELNKKSTHLLLSDISGERFQSARDYSSSMKSLDLLKTADHLFVMIDGERLSKNLTRHGVIFNVQMFIKNALDDEMFDRKTQLNVIISKCDLLKDFDFTKLIETPFNNEFSHRLKGLKFIKLAARPEEGPLNGFGIEEILDICTENRTHSFEFPHLISERDRYFDLYKTVKA
jgi:hypothetical protein